MGVWGQRPQQAEAYAEGKGSEHASDPCRRHGQKLVFHYSSTWCLAKNDRSCITDNYHVIIYVSYLVCLSFIIPRRGAALVPWQRAIDLVLLTVIMSLSYLVCLSYHYSVASDR